MASSYRMLIAGLSALTGLVSLAIYVIFVQPFFAHFIPLLKANTPPYWWAYLHGDMIIWIMAMVYFLIIATAILIPVRLFLEATRTTGYEGEP